ncbi:hypothetical protein [Photobacterium galatheae]|uniref:Membrane protein n=1 Tax=Photobacterium galatheae TaxID=1654360 RepID=A0A066RRT2_9GAMM|nr:hypothetical protein [Photobacterium galatheae]KDM93135.1 membrane protein [Photobacterium galatheae]MCM0148337.1 hypothetical protein [Photobacterium galatheae]
MLNAILLSTMSVVLTVIGVSTFGLSQHYLTVLAVAIPALWLLPQGGLSSVLLLCGIGAYSAALPYQPLALSVSLLVMLPVFSVSFSSKANWQVGALLFAIVIAMDAGLLALQGDGKLGGQMSFTLLQIMAVGLIWCAGHFWRPVKGNYGLPLLLAVPLWLSDLAPAALVVLCIIGLILALQTLYQRYTLDWVTRLSWVLPAVAFAAVAIDPAFDVPNPVLVSWLMVLGSAILGEYLLAEVEDA